MKHESGTDGDEPARAAPTLRELLPQHLRHLTAFVRTCMTRALRDQESASDLVGSICGDLLRESVRFEYRGEAQFLAWLRTVAANKIRGRLRSARTTAVTLLEEPAGEQATALQLAILVEDLGLLDRAMGMLPEHYRELLVRSHLRGQSRAEMAAGLQMSEAAVANMLVRARAKLAEKLDRLSGGAQG